MALIFLLESDRQLAKNTRDFFKRAGHQLSNYADPQAAITAAAARPPDIIIVDLFLASRTGIEFLYELRSYHEWQKIPVIITGSLPAEELGAYQAAFNELSVTRYLTSQTSSLSELLVQVEKALQPVGA